MAGHDRQLVNGGTSPYHSLTCKKAKRRRKLVTWPVFVSDHFDLLQIGFLSGSCWKADHDAKSLPKLPMFDLTSAPIGLWWK